MQPTPPDLSALALAIKRWGAELGFAEVRIADVDLTHAEAGLQAWLDAGRHGEMDYMASHGMKRARPAELVPGTVRVITARMDYLPAATPHDWRERERARLADPRAAVISIYARGRDYHKVLRSRLQQLAERIRTVTGEYGFRVFTDSAPVMELPLAEKAGLGWRGKHTLMLNREAGSMFFLGEILVDIALPVDGPVDAHCGQCQACIDVCPTQAIVGPGRLDARRCISYLTIELKSSIPEALRPLIGNRVYGCDDCQTVCPWNKFAQRAVVPDFEERNSLGSESMAALFAWDDGEFNRRLEGSPIRRIGHERWLRNLAVGLGNAADAMPGDAAVVAALQARSAHPSAMVREHVAWALARHGIYPDGAMRLSRTADQSPSSEIMATPVTPR
ncbi:tRNA epoxyqueuosine(34) reductase QueG [Massilia sp. PAMC28688]|uniref:tRNA epoxyqueuosine(34) reductase QueG n=1 Tax=Massilia sp. PAMC28688 TaxID=2861283 RepID=UPI001C63890B|nr:tRNA epoxyqueuosine(34) reductase QueG [Massilia sp. PAMC28688]QYF91677.1 tRNA epoxyqueuosine(34) reductase QueG [Massilia sp. PAMC28688]